MRDNFEVPAKVGRRLDRTWHRANGARHNDNTRLYHGAMRIPEDVLAGLDSPEYVFAGRTGSRNRFIDRDGVTWLSNVHLSICGVVLGEIVKTPGGAYRVHVFREITLRDGCVAADPRYKIERRTEYVLIDPPLPRFPSAEELLG